MNTKESRLAAYERDIASWESQLTPEAQAALLRIARESFERGYSEGFADGMVRGQNYQAEITTMVLGNIFRPKSEGDEVMEEAARLLKAL